MAPTRHQVVKYLRTELLQPGDVILSRGLSKHSKVISWFTWGRYSHAALVVSSVYRLEAQADGIGFTPVKIAKCEYHKDGSGYRHLQSISDVKHLVVLRHDDAKGREEELQKKIYERSYKYIGLEYPAFNELSWAATTIRPLRWVYDKALALLDTITKRRVVNPGPSCSVLVALIYTELGLRLFDRERSPRAVSPNALLKSNLKRVPDVICAEDVSIPNNDVLMRELNSDREMLPRNKMLPPLVKGKRTIVEAQRFLGLIEKLGRPIRRDKG